MEAFCWPSELTHVLPVKTVIICAYGFSLERFLDELFIRRNVARPSHMASRATKRKAEFLCGDTLHN